MNVTNKARERYSYSLILLKQIIKTDFKLRYQGSALGYLWSLLRPLLLFLILYLVFAKFLRLGGDIPHYPVYLLVGILLWNFFSEITSGSVGAIVGKGDLIRKLNFPKYVIVLASCASALINLGLNAFVIIIFMVFAGVDVGWQAFMVAPLVLELAVFAVALGFILSAMFVRLRDVSYIWEVVLQAGFYATPIIYPLTLLPQYAQEVLLLSPVAQVIQDVRYALVTPETVVPREVYDNVALLFVPLVIVLGTGVIAVVYFKRRARTFAEEV